MKNLIAAVDALVAMSNKLNGQIDENNIQNQKFIEAVNAACRTYGTEVVAEALIKRSVKRRVNYDDANDLL